MKYFKLTFSVMFISLLTVSCGKEDGPSTSNDTFDRELMLAHWADDIIIPAFETYLEDIVEMDGAIKALAESPTIESLSSVRAAWITAYTSWQAVSLYQIGKAEEVQLGNFTNIYPTNATQIDVYLKEGAPNLLLPSTNSSQGFPAIEYCIYGLDKNDQDIVTIFQNEANAKSYLIALSERMKSITTEVTEHWKTSYRDIFVSQSGSSATASVNKMTNDYIYVFEKVLRANKVGIPAGVFSTSPFADKVEGRYANDISKRLFLAHLDAMQHFFNGQFFTDTSKGDGYVDYLKHLDKGDIAADINSQMDLVRNLVSALDDDFEQQILSDNTKMLSLYDELQKAVVLLKVDMMQALNIKVDYVDADGD